LNLLWETLPVPFPDEAFSQHGVRVVDYRPGWAAEGVELTAWLGRLLPEAQATDHIGSTSVPGLPAKDCLDLMVRVESLSDIDLRPLTDMGYRERPEEWNRSETLGTTRHPKRVIAPPVGGRPINIHVRETHGETARYALLFRDFLQVNDDHRDSWGRFKLRLAQECPNLHVYGQMKAAAQPLLMALAELWAAERDWHPSLRISHSSSACGAGDRRPR
jgi:dephospho-CoA kinase